jgi:hypothetical protein
VKRAKAMETKHAHRKLGGDKNKKKKHNCQVFDKDVAPPP